MRQQHCVLSEDRQRNGKDEYLYVVKGQIVTLVIKYGGVHLVKSYSITNTVWLVGVIWNPSRYRMTQISGESNRCATEKKSHKTPPEWKKVAPAHGDTVIGKWFVTHDLAANFMYQWMKNPRKKLTLLINSGTEIKYRRLPIHSSLDWTFIEPSSVDGNFFSFSRWTKDFNSQ